MARKSVTSDFQIFPERLSDLMKKKGLTQQNLADSLGVKRQTISLYKSGQSMPDAKMLRDLAVYFGVSADYLLGLSDYMSMENSNLTFMDMEFSEKTINAIVELKKYPEKYSAFIDILNRLIPICEFQSFLIRSYKLMKEIDIFLDTPHPAPFTNSEKNAQICAKKAVEILSQTGGLYKIIGDSDYIKMEEYYLQESIKKILHEVIYDSEESIKQLRLLEQNS